MKALISKLAPYLFWLAFLIVTGLLLIDLPPSTGGLPLSDKIIHATVFFVLTALGLLAYKHHSVWVGLGLVIYGALTEFLQGELTATRMPSLLDWVADIVGITLVFLLVLLMPSLKRLAHDE